MRLLLIAVMLLTGCASAPHQTIHADGKWSERNYQIMMGCGAEYESDADYSECLLINNATI
jgi:uncharacterized protein YceK